MTPSHYLSNVPEWPKSPKRDRLVCKATAGDQYLMGLILLSILLDWPLLAVSTYGTTSPECVWHEELPEIILENN